MNSTHNPPAHCPGLPIGGVAASANALSNARLRQLTGGLMGLLAVVGNILGVALLWQSPSAYRLAKIGPWVLESLATPRATSASASAFTPGLLALAAWARQLGRVSGGALALFGANLIAVTSLFNAAGALTPLVLALHVGDCGALAWHLGARALGKGEDFRYAAMRARRPRSFPLSSLLIIFGLQILVALIVALPVHAMMASKSTAWGILDGLGASLAGLGVMLEAIADAQLRGFWREAGSRGSVLDRGLWRYSRHPNYFGDFCFWWGIGLVGLAVAPWWVLAGPLLMTIFLLRVSGVTLLEATITERRPDYARYVQRTSAFFPWPPRETGEGVR